jgi:hypothetical protein
MSDKKNGSLPVTPTPNKQLSIPEKRTDRGGTYDSVSNNNTVSFTRPIPPKPTPPTK